MRYFCTFYCKEGLDNQHSHFECEAKNPDEAHKKALKFYQANVPTMTHGLGWDRSKFIPFAISIMDCTPGKVIIKRVLHELTERPKKKKEEMPEKKEEREMPEKREEKQGEDNGGLEAEIVEEEAVIEAEEEKQEKQETAEEWKEKLKARMQREEEERTGLPGRRFPSQVKE